LAPGGLYASLRERGSGGKGADRLGRGIASPIRKPQGSRCSRKNRRLPLAKADKAASPAPPIENPWLLFRAFDIS